MKTILLTGGSGLLALNWAAAMRESHQVILGQHRRSAELAGVRSHLINIESPEQIVAAIGKWNPDVVIHAAGLTSVELCEKNPDLAQYVNVDLAVNVAQACKQSNVKLVHISTDHLFAGNMQTVSEDEPIAPVNVYARTKGEAEARVLDSYPDTLAIRTNFYGWGPSYRLSFSDIIIDALRKKKSITLFSDVFYTPILVQPAVEAIHALLEKQAAGIFNVVGKDRISKYEFGMKIAEIFELDSHVIESGLMADQLSMVKRPLDMSLSDHKIASFLGKNLGGVEQHLTQLRRQEKDGQAKEIQIL